MTDNEKKLETSEVDEQSKESKDNNAVSSKPKKLDPVMIICLLIGVVLVIFALVKLFFIYEGYQVSENEYHEIESQYVEVAQDVTIGVEETDIPWYEYAKVDVAALQEINSDVCGYILFENEDISYPVLHTYDNDYYLHRTVEKTEAKAGSIFMECANNSDFEDSHTIIYGHNMKNLSMFGKLRYYRTDKEYYDDHQYFQIFTNDAVYRYQVYAYKVILDGSYIYETYYTGSDDFVAFANQIGSDSSRNTGIEITADDKIITLSTCTGNDDERFVVTAVRVDQHYFDAEDLTSEGTTEGDNE